VTGSHIVRRRLEFSMERYAVLHSDAAPVRDVWEGPELPFPEEILDMIDNLVTTENPGRMTLGSNLDFKEFGSGFGAHVSLSFDIDQTTEAAETARERVGEFLVGLVAEQTVEAQHMWEDLKSGAQATLKAST